MNLGTPVFEIHSKKSQPQRSATSEQFRLCRSGILFSSDVSARGMDYPDVTFVLQLGNPPDRAQYLPMSRPSPIWPASAALESDQQGLAALGCRPGHPLALAKPARRHSGRTLVGPTLLFDLGGAPERGRA